MNPLPDISADSPVSSATAKTAAQLENCVRQHPGGTLLAAAGFGIAAILIARALTPATPRNRAMRLLEDIQQRLAGLAEDGAHAVDKGMNSLGDLHLDRKLGKFSRGIKGLFH
jgi:hypothetical protein